ncbi:helix-turn-helix transcriptional regulator [Streptococcus uberis]|uniref:helix-turn-helix transcriptional regulator n=1 Tax=Streptococcus uberis TaxID=1349 RepID=UPI003D6B6233
MVEISIAMARKKADLTQAKIAEKLGVSRTTYRSWEHYKVSMDIPTGYKFSKITGVPFDDITFFKKESTLEV